MLQQRINSFPQVVIDDSVLTFKHGTSIVLPCSVRGYPIPVIRWYKNNTPLPKSERISVSEENTLELSKATPIDGGTFTCRCVIAYNSGRICAEFVLVFQGDQQARKCL